MALITCPDCGKEISENAPACPNCGGPVKQNNPAPKPNPPKKKGGCLKMMVIGVGLIIVLRVIGSSASNKEPDQLTYSPGATPSTAVAPVPAPAPVPVPDPRVELQVKFEETLALFSKQFKDSQNELQESTARKNRKQAIGELNLARNLDGWVGTLASLSTNSDGNAIISVKLNQNLELGTWNNALSDIQDGTLIKSDSQLYKTLANMSKGQKIKFSGSFISSEEDFYKEKSITIHGSMTDPEFLFKFKSVEPIN